MLYSKYWKDLRNRLDDVQAEIDMNSHLIPPELICQLLICGEDHRFYCHAGVDPFAMCRAIWKTIICRKRQGGSTIAMQLARTLTGRYEKTFYRKLREIVLAIRLTKYIDRASIPVIYLWVAYYGSGMNSFKQACKRLNLKPISMSELDASRLVARLKYPEPREFRARREAQIQMRADHLIQFRRKHFQYDQSRKINGTLSYTKALSGPN